jgi:hypothetical protein|tara:strand:- start:8965 stop:9300 length:336 start_codon:yes stop_codon:yes gene_type:complete
MLISEVIFKEDDTTKQSIIDLLTVMSGEGIGTVSLETLLGELSKEGINLDKATLFDVLNNLAIVDNIKDDVVYFNTHSKAFKSFDKTSDPEKADNKIDQMARKTVKRELDK